MPRTKSLKQLAIDYDVHYTTMKRWLQSVFPHWYSPKATVKPSMKARKKQNKGNYTPKEIKMIHQYFGEPN